MLGNPATKAHQVLNNNCNTQTVHVQSAINVQVCIKTCTVPYMSMQCILLLSLHSLAQCWLRTVASAKHDEDGYDAVDDDDVQNDDDHHHDDDDHVD